MPTSEAGTGVHERLWGLRARTLPGVTLEEYAFWAKIEREMEEAEYKRYLAATKNQNFLGGIKAYFSLKGVNVARAIEAVSDTPLALPDVTANEKPANVVATTEGADGARLSSVSPTHDYDAEWRRAARALRTSGWMTVFYLITTDILGWSQTPYAFASAGYGVAASSFIVFGIAASASGFMIWRTFIGLDSSRYPILSFGDPFLRLFGPKTRTFINILQAFQIFCTVAVILISNSQKLSQLVHAKICYIAIVTIVAVIAMLSGWLLALRHLGWLCNFAVWINVVSFIVIMVAAAIHGPDTTVAIQTTLIKKSEPVKTFVGVPSPQYQQQTTNMFAAVLNGIDTIAYAYYGALLFIAFMAEMRRPMDFWKAMLLAQVFICLIYLLFGAFVYHFLGQYSIPSITQVIGPYALQVLCNILSLIIGFLAIFLYFNVGLKTVYLEVGQEVLGLPAMTETKGYILWLALGPVYWILAMVVAVSVPSFAGLTNLISGLLIVNFTYSIPAIMYVAYIIQKYSELPGEGFDPHTGVTTRYDVGWKRHIRGLRRSWYISIPITLFACGGLACSALGSWSAVESLIEIFGPGGTIQTSWGCTPVG
ncbi:uncharacterized protein Z520_08637 [Fonsecaea multimorphosa CBS 102226]|uniref:Amino acid transporter transmembrane domain-containing protein n=1 Tax=Fonsecaea multimorphosa CBS 102226 TaxID=1442371 RepID=A0A0D2JQ93_9EURO|nr:uncharacterized protein Z520_08637 [Fonsecaea multimorphosa CBS 102226]KIX95517.1 hypothetical protein Z520_08637 [Fonsecaea multimorphosa CBS 102226]OAL21363.1 hypothetical protein AYO22_08086 [Fonsecaea multimorphosa]